MSSSHDGFSVADWPVAILAGGLATRLRPITEKIPKALITVASQPFLGHQLRLLQMAGIRKVVLCVGYRGEMIKQAFGDGSSHGVGLSYSFDGPALLGTGGALKKALPLLGGQFLVLYGDSYLPIDYAAPARAFGASGKLGLMTVFKNEGRWERSNVWFDHGEIKRYDKTQSAPEMKHIDYGLGALRSQALLQWPNERPFDLADVYQDLVGKRELAGYEVDRRFYEIGSPNGLAELDSMLRSQEPPITP
ncbi:MAG: N-acetyl-alpha-D-muramate 1-phosphate uridylyltransferase [Verrucomicrobiota bacterium]|jgi:NDP-sugar pyrophosphorylase family protein